jgi:6-hydroxytryprostatin B O-methyltransferase
MPSAKFIVQDNNVAALEMGRRDVKAQSDDLQTRIEFDEYDFFTPQPVRADMYIFRHILHDWNDTDSVRILSSLLPALEPGARVLISEGLLPQPPATRLNTLASKMIRLVFFFLSYSPALKSANWRSRAESRMHSCWRRTTPKNAV